MASNKNAATEDEVGLIHRGITLALGKGVAHMLKKIELAEEIEDELERSIAMDMAFNEKLINAATKWTQFNEVTCQIDAQDGKSELSKNLERIRENQKGKVLKLVEGQ